MGDLFVAFDFDGVIANSFYVALEEYEKIITAEFPSIPVPKNKEDMVRVFPGPLKTSLRQFGLSDHDCRKFFDLHSLAMLNRIDDVSLFSHVADIITSMSPENFAIVTSAYSESVRSSFHKHFPGSLSKDVNIMGRELSMSKSEKLASIAAAMQIDASSIVKIGDMVSDILYARSAGFSILACG